MEQKSEKRYRLYVLTSILALTLSTFNLVMAGNMAQDRTSDGYMYISADANSDSLKANLLDMSLHSSDMFFSPQTPPSEVTKENMSEQRRNDGLMGI